MAAGLTGPGEVTVVAYAEAAGGTTVVGLDPLEPHPASRTASAAPIVARATVVTRVVSVVMPVPSPAPLTGSETPWCPKAAVRWSTPAGSPPAAGPPPRVSAERSRRSAVDGPSVDGPSVADEPAGDEEDS